MVDGPWDHAVAHVRAVRGEGHDHTKYANGRGKKEGGHCIFKLSSFMLAAYLACHVGSVR